MLEALGGRRGESNALAQAVTQIKPFVPRLLLSSEVACDIQNKVRKTRGEWIDRTVVVPHN